MLRSLPASHTLAATPAIQRQMVTECLAQHGFARNSRRWLSDAARLTEEGPRLSRALRQLGPVFVAFGRYLSTRADVLPIADCLALAALPNAAPVLPAAQVWRLLGQEWGESPAQFLAAFARAPSGGDWSYQAHAARLRDGTAVTVKVARPALIEVETELLRLVTEALSHDARRAFLLEQAVTDFQRQTEAEGDFTRVAAQQREFAAATAQNGWLRAPRLWEGLCTARVLVVEQLPGVSLAAWGARAGRAGATETLAALGWEARQLANRLWLLWLHAALQGSCFPLLPHAAEIQLLPDQQLAFIGHGFARLPVESQAHLRDYLEAAAVCDVERVGDALRRELEAAPAAGAPAELAHRLRQLAPFREGAWAGRREKETLAEQLFLQWRLAGDLGYRPRGPTRDFWRSLFALAGAAQSLAPAHDALREGLEDWRLHRVFMQFGELFGLHRLGEQAGQYAALWLEGPQRLDEALTRLADGRAFAATSQSNRALNGVLTLLSVLLWLGALALWARSNMIAPGLEKCLAAALLALGAWWLRAVGQGDGNKL